MHMPDRLEARTGLNLDDSGVIRVLDTSAWSKRRRFFKVNDEALPTVRLSNVTEPVLGTLANRSASDRKDQSSCPTPST